MATAAMQQSVAYAAGGPPAAPVIVDPQPYKNEADSIGIRSRSAIAKEVFEAHKAGLQARRERDLLSEMYLLHIDGSADFQFATIWNGQRIEIPREVAEFRKSENLLRLVVDNAVAHHTTMPLRYLAEAGHDRASRDRATIDTIWANHLAQTQDFNGLFAETMYLAMPAGFCTIHGYWREDVPRAWYEPAAYGQEAYGQEGPEQGGYGQDGQQQQAPDGQDLPPGMIDCFVGNPFGTVFDGSARRGSYRWSSYERWVPMSAIKEQFGHLPGVDGLQGTTRMTSAAEIQQIARDWLSSGIGVHGSPVTTERRDKNEEMILVVCREEAPRGRSDPQGRLRIVAVPGTVDPRRGQGKSSNCLLLADQKLPGRDYSFSVFYAAHRGSDVHGKPWVEDIDQMQVDLNIALSKRWEVLHRQIEAPIVAPGGAISDDMADVGAYQLLEVDPSLGNWRPRVMEWPQGILPSLENYIKELKSAIFTAGGYQASSRGEAAGSRIAAQAILALQHADATVHGPVNVRFQRSACDFMRRNHSQMKTYGHQPWLVSVVGPEYEYLTEAYGQIDRTMLSDRPPQFKLVNSFGSSPDATKQEIIELMQLRGADGQPFLSTEQAQRLWPDPITVNSDDPTPVKRRRAKTIAKKIQTLATDFREQTGMQEQGRAHPWVQRAGMIVFYQAEQLFPRDRADLLEAHIAALEEVTQDETADPIARVAAQLRLELYYQWQAAMAGIAMPGSPGSQAGTPPGAQPGNRLDRAGVAAEMGRRGQGTTLQAVEDAGGQAAASANR